MNPTRGDADPRRAARLAMRHLLHALCPRRRGRPPFLALAGLRAPTLTPTNLRPFKTMIALPSLTKTTPAKPWPRQADVPAFFGRIELGADGLPTDRWQARMLTTIPLPYPMRLSWDLQTTVRKITCHRAVADSLTACLAAVLAHYGSLAAVQAAGLDLYGGCYNFRPMRGSHVLSMHAYGIAIDLDPEHNPQFARWKEDKGMMPMAVVDIFEAAGWTWGGRWTSRTDCMHFQAASI